MITDSGRVPINVRDIQGTVTFAKGAGLKAVTYDAYGYAKGTAEPVKVAAVTLAKDGM